MPQTPTNILAQALATKQKLDELVLLGDKLYICMSCGHVSDYWKPGQVCYGCEAEGEREQEFDQ